MHAHPVFKGGKTYEFTGIYESCRRETFARI